MTASNASVPPRIMLLISPSSYRGEAFSRAARQLDLEMIPVYDMPDEFEPRRSFQVTLDFRDVDASVSHIREIHQSSPLTAILSVDDSATELAAVASEALGLPANDPRSAHAARDKFVMRSMLQDAGVRCPAFQLVEPDANLDEFVTTIEFPVVVKPRTLSGSRGVIRANDPAELQKAISQTRAIVAADTGDQAGATVLVERYLPGGEVAVEGVLSNGEVQILAIFDKPDPLEGPYFEETIYVTPSRLSEQVLKRIADETSKAARALGLRHGPIHAELRIDDERAWLLEIAGRSIGGL